MKARARRGSSTDETGADDGRPADGLRLMERDVLDLQESAGNAAVAGLVGGASVQRADDQPDSVGASSSGNAVMRALWNGNVIDPLKTATQALILEPSDYKRAYAKTVQALETASMAKDGMAASDPNRAQVLSLARDLQFVLLKIAHP